MHGTETTPNDTFCHSLSLHDALPISVFVPAVPARRIGGEPAKNTRSRRGREVPSDAIIDSANCRHWITGQILVPHVMDRHVRMRLPICHHADLTVMPEVKHLLPQSNRILLLISRRTEHADELRDGSNHCCRITVGLHEDGEIGSATCRERVCPY